MASLDPQRVRAALLILMATVSWLAPLTASSPAHAETAASTKSPHGSLKEACADCHRAEYWKPARITPAFDHAAAGFKLAGAHATTACMTCHTSLVFARAQTQCVSCHQDPHRGEMGTDCAHCHGERDFIDRGPMVRAHQTTRFPLTGAHARVDCEDCHTPAAQGRLQFVGLQRDCFGCHRADYLTAKTPDHVAGGYPTNCTQCHGTILWGTSRFDHERTTFPLTGRHVTTPCVQCHTTGRFEAVSAACQSCHNDVFVSAKPHHAAAGFQAAACTSCHTTRTWTGGRFDHTAETRFTLTGAHRTGTCDDCHADDVFRGKTQDCYGCHQPSYVAATPVHTPVNYPTPVCATCHTTNAWTGGAFDHMTQTRFPLTGAHRTSTCQDCHASGVFASLRADCLGCHQPSWTAAARLVDHDAARLSASECESCHGTSTWTGGKFDHTARTSYPLVGRHAVTACNGCHGDNLYAGKTSACYGCHSSDYANAEPPHVDLGFPSANCSSCHNTSSFHGTSYSHDRNWFAVYSGKHDGTWGQCVDCHVAPDYKNYNCLSCHPHSDKADTDSKHVRVAGYTYVNSECYRCHPTGNR
jgi:hypothetical protein